jgi:hypothetical protein
MDAVQAGFGCQLIFGIVGVLVLAHCIPFLGMVGALGLLWLYSQFGALLF